MGIVFRGDYFRPPESEYAKVSYGKEAWDEVEAEYHTVNRKE